MTANTRKLGRRQVDVLRAAAAGNLVRFDSGTWDAPSGACTASAKSVAARGLLVEAGRMFRYTLGSGRSEPGTTMRLSAEGERVLAEWDQQNPEAVAARERRAAAIKALAAKPGLITSDDLLRLAANDERLDDDTFRTVARAVDGRPVIDNEND